ncbi:MAG: DUF488 domain-containing protein [Bacillota bacterium]|jgi:uncharacterized protein YeaO (DUF488 family)
MNTIYKGQVITASISSLKYINCDEVWQITRSSNTIPGSIWVPELSPSPVLFHQYLYHWKDKPPEEWWPYYAEIFNRELRSREKLKVVSRLKSRVERGETIALVCFCKERKYCHRSLVGDFLKQHDIVTEEYIKVNARKVGDYIEVEQLTLF